MAKCVQDLFYIFVRNLAATHYFASKMSTPIQELGLRNAIESLRRAEQRLNDYMDNPSNQPLNTAHPTFVFLLAQVTRCTNILMGAQQTLQTLATQNRGIFVV